MDLPAPTEVIKVSREQAKRARLAKAVETVSKSNTHTGGRQQKGPGAAQAILENVVTIVNGKKAIVVLDFFASVGDFAFGFYQICKSRGQAAAPMISYIGFDPREHFCGIAHTRLLSSAMDDFNKERLLIPGHCPLPPIPPAWAGCLKLFCSVR